MIVCYSVNDKYYDLFEVSLKSLLDFNSVCKIYVLCSKLLNESIISAKSICVNRCEIEFINIDLNMFRNIEMKHLEAEAYYRLLIPKLINDEKVWYIDVDTVILGSIEQPYYETCDFMVAAVPILDQHSQVKKKNRLKMSTNAQYFNSGVMLLDLVEIRSHDLFNITVDWINKNLDLVQLADQDGLNVMLNGNYHKLDISYNVYTSVAKKVKNPIIVHFTGEFKPNLFLYRHPYKKVFRRYFSYNKKSFNVALNIRYLKKSLRSYAFGVASKIPFLLRVYRKLKSKIV